MTTARTISERLEGELRRIEEEIRRTGGEAALLDRSDPHGESARMGDLYDRASATGATEMACETLIRLTTPGISRRGVTKQERSWLSRS